MCFVVLHKSFFTSSCLSLASLLAHAGTNPAFPPSPLSEYPYHEVQPHQAQVVAEARAVVDKLLLPTLGKRPLPSAPAAAAAAVRKSTL